MSLGSRDSSPPPVQPIPQSWGWPELGGGSTYESQESSASSSPPPTPGHEETDLSSSHTVGRSELNDLVPQQLSSEPLADEGHGPGWNTSSDVGTDEMSNVYGTRAADQVVRADPPDDEMSGEDTGRVTELPDSGDDEMKSKRDEVPWEPRRSTRPGRIPSESRSSTHSGQVSAEGRSSNRSDKRRETLTVDHGSTRPDEAWEAFTTGHRSTRPDQASLESRLPTRPEEVRETLTEGSHSSQSYHTAQGASRPRFPLQLTQHQPQLASGASKKRKGSSESQTNQIPIDQNSKRVLTGEKSVKKSDVGSRLERIARTREVAATMKDRDKAERMLAAAARNEAAHINGNRDRKRKNAEQKRATRELDARIRDRQIARNLGHGDDTEESHHQSGASDVYDGY